MPTGHGQVHVGDGDVLDGNTNPSADRVGELSASAAGVNSGDVCDADVADDTDRRPRSAATGTVASFDPDRDGCARHGNGVVGYAVDDCTIIGGDSNPSLSGG